jgi:Na+-transporting methylmalonyl-CoA/oxaloacetate decarboxylase gamma subunit
MENLSWGLTMTGLGMGLVFALLALLWGLLTLIGRLDRERTRPGSAGEPAAAVMPGTGADAATTVPMAVSSADESMAPDLVAAITVAALMHKSVLRREAAPMMRSYWPGSLLYASRWVAVGRGRQNQSWQRRGK